MDVVIIPAYQPNGALVTLVDRLIDNGLAVLVVDDGSGDDYKIIFDAIRDKVELITHDKNRGKGAALKSAFSEIKARFPDAGTFITADADAQHTVEDILRVRDELSRGADMVLTVRNFRENVPLRSKIGNYLSRWIYTALTGHYFSDNQSGLRGFQAHHAEWLVKVGGDKYDYEMNVLYYADKQSIPITTISIETVYIDGNKSSHFDPVRDTLRIYKRLLISAQMSIFSFLLTELIVLVSSIVFGYKLVFITVPFACVYSAVVSVLLNRFIIFRRVRYRDATRTITYTALRSVAYTAFCLAMGFILPTLPMILSFNIVAVVLVPLEYLAHKLIHNTRYKDINKEQTK